VLKDPQTDFTFTFYILLLLFALNVHARHEGK
jgi:hypothetical protein